MLKPHRLRVAVTARERTVLFGFLLWTLLIIARLTQVMVLDRPPRLDELAYESVTRNDAAVDKGAGALPALALAPAAGNSGLLSGHWYGMKPTE
jgi:hypothetical protein